MVSAPASGRLLADEGGFTLVEALVAATVMTAVLFSLYAVFDATVRVFEVAEDELEATQNARLGMARMEREIRAAYPHEGGVLLDAWEPTRIAFRNKPTDAQPEAIVYSVSTGYLRRNGQRVAGPLAEPEGLRFAYCESATGCSTPPNGEAEIGLVRITLGVRSGGPEKARTLTTDVTLRNRE